MVHVIASIRLKPGALSAYLAVLKAVVPSVRAEKGCIRYVPTVDLDAGLSVQSADKDVVTIIEQWESREMLLAHLGSVHMLEYREKVKDMVENVSVRVLQQV